MVIFQSSFGHNNWYDYTFSVDLAAQSGYVYLDYYNSYIPTVRDFQDAADQTARLIANTYPKLFLGFSGGIDSVFVGEVLVRNKIDFTPIIIKHPRDGLANSADDWCRSKNLTPVVIDIVKNKKKYIRYLWQTSRFADFSWGAIYAAVLTEVAQQYQGHVIRGAGELSVHFQSQDIDSKFEIVVGQVPWLGHYDLCLDFFIYTPEIVMAQAMFADLSLPLNQTKSKLYELPVIPKDFDFNPSADYQDIWAKFCVLNNRPDIKWNHQYRTPEQVLHELTQKNCRQQIFNTYVK
jgi:hypothetical protein